MSIKPLMDWLVYLAARVVICIVQSMRMETCEAIARALAVLAADVLKIRGKVVDDNLRAAFPQLTVRQQKLLTRRMWEHLILMICEIAHAPRKVHRNNFWRHAHFKPSREVMRHMIDPRPKIVLTGHYGNFELGGFFGGLMGFPSCIVARDLDNPYLNRLVHRFRASTGHVVLPKHGVAVTIDRMLARGYSLAFLGDQHAGPNGCWVDFFGRPASCHKAIALFALTSKALVLVGCTRRVGGTMRFQYEMAGVADPAAPDGELGGVKEITRWYNERLEYLICTAPEQYWWLHRRWKGEPGRRARRSKTAA